MAGKAKRAHKQCSLQLFAKACKTWEETKQKFAKLAVGSCVGFLQSVVDEFEARTEAGELYQVMGSYGALYADKNGFIVGWQDDNWGWITECPEEYNMIRLFDMPSYLAHSKSHYVDICEMDDWDDEGNYTGHSPGTRKLVKQNQKRRGKK